MSKKTRLLPHCFYCSRLTNGGKSAIDHVTDVCVDCAYCESIDPRSAADRWMSLGGDRGECLAFLGSLRRQTPRLVAAAAGGAL